MAKRKTSEAYGAEGGKKRAERLTKAELAAIGRKGALARWGKTTPQAIYGSPEQPLRIANVEIPCYVLDDGTRVLAQRGLKEAIGMSASGGTSGAQRVARFVESLGAKGVDISDLAVRITTPIKFSAPGIGAVAFGYEATIIPDLCDVVWEAYQRGLLQKQQAHIGIQCQAVTRALAKTGIIALIDEATGYQRVREERALAEILEKFISKELRPWSRRFPFEFYTEMFRLKGWDTSELTPNSPKPREVGRLTDDLIYQRLAPAVRAELKRLTPRNDKGFLRHKMHQHLTDDLGNAKLEKHISNVITTMKLSHGWDNFADNVNRLFRKYGDEPELELGG